LKNNNGESKMIDTIAIIQARMGSTRLPNKMLLSLHGKPIIEWVVKRVQKSKLLDAIVVAIPNTKKDEILENYLKDLGVEVFKGSEENVLNRFYASVKDKQPKNIVRICADNPLICPKEIDNLISFYKNNNCDYAYNHIPKNNLYPDGLGAEMISFELLEWLEKNVTDTKHREHCLSYITDNSDKFVIKTFNPSQELQYPNIKLDIDTFEDFAKLSQKKFDIDTEATELIKLFKEQK
jgi:spore coat polysaccharide biosynthesis protein SpsF